MGVISERYHAVTNRYYRLFSLRLIFCAKMKNKPALESDSRTNFRAASEKLNFTKPLAELRPDPEDNQQIWSGKLSSNGWQKPGLGPVTVIEMATAAKHGDIG